MERIRNLSPLQRGLLVVLCAMLVAFGVLYAVVTGRVGYEHRDGILLPETRGDTTVYSGKVLGKPAAFTVDSGQGSVTFSYDGKTYGPYVAMEDPTAIPREYAGYEDFTGVELWDGTERIFRGYVFLGTDGPVYFTEEGTGPAVTITYTSDGVEYDSDGNVVDPMEPGVYTLLELLYAPTFVHRGNWGLYLLGVVISVAAAVSMLYARELFYWNLSFSIENAREARPTELLLMQWKIGWVVLCALTLFVYIVGLQ